MKWRGLPVYIFKKHGNNSPRSWIELTFIIDKRGDDACQPFNCKLRNQERYDKKNDDDSLTIFQVLL